MANEQLRNAIHEAGIELDQLAEQIRVDPKTIERWVAGRTPYPRYRTRLARALGREQRELWPGLTPEPDPLDAEDENPAGAPTGERADDESLVPVFATPEDPAAPAWQTLLHTAVSVIDLLDLTLTYIIGEQAAVDTLAAKAQDGVNIRVLISDPESAHLTVTEAETETGHQLTTRSALSTHAARTLELLKPLRDTEKLQVRTFVAPAYHTILRADDQQLISPHLYATPPERSPVLHLHAEQQPALFEQFAGHYQRIWQQASLPAS